MRIITCFFVLLSLSACDSGTWADAMGGGGGCKNGKPEGTPDEIKMVAKLMCDTRQKNYTGDFQCKGDDLQVKCK